MPRLNQNQRIQALTMFARGDNVSNVSRAFGCHRNTALRQRFQQTGGVADRRRHEFLEEEGNVLLIIVPLRGTDLEVGVL